MSNSIHAGLKALFYCIQCSTLLLLLLQIYNNTVSFATVSYSNSMLTYGMNLIISLITVGQE